MNAPGSNEVQIDHFSYNGHGQGHKVIDPGVIWKCLLVEYA